MLFVSPALNANFTGGNTWLMPAAQRRASSATSALASPVVEKPFQQGAPAVDDALVEADGGGAVVLLVVVADVALAVVAVDAVGAVAEALPLVVADALGPALTAEIPEEVGVTEGLFPPGPQPIAETVTGKAKGVSTRNSVRSMGVLRRSVGIAAIGFDIVPVGKTFLALFDSSPR